MVSWYRKEKPTGSGHEPDKATADLGVESEAADYKKSPRVASCGVEIGRLPTLHIGGLFRFAGNCGMMISTKRDFLEVFVCTNTEY